MFPEVSQEGVATPAAHNLHNFHGHTPEQVEQGGTYSYAMALEGLEACLASGSGKALDESWFREGAYLVLVPVGKKVGALLGGADAQVVV